MAHDVARSRRYGDRQEPHAEAGLLRRLHICSRVTMPHARVFESHFRRCSRERLEELLVGWMASRPCQPANIDDRQHKKKAQTSTGHSSGVGVVRAVPCRTLLRRAVRRRDHHAGNVIDTQLRCIVERGLHRPHDHFPARTSSRPVGSSSQLTVALISTPISSIPQTSRS